MSVFDHDDCELDSREKESESELYGTLRHFYSTDYFAKIIYTNLFTKKLIL